MSAQIIPFPRTRRLSEEELWADFREMLQANGPGLTDAQFDAKKARVEESLRLAAESIGKLPKKAD